MYHPDLGGSEEKMKELNAAYQDALKGTKQEKYTYNEEHETELMNKIYEFLTLKADLTVLLIGKWIWITGDTKKVKTELKEKGCFWHNTKKCWYYKPKSMKWRPTRGKGEFAQMAAKYGAKGFTTTAENRSVKVA